MLWGVKVRISKNFYVTNKDGNTETVDGYMWVHDLAELRAMNTNLGGHYALRNSIDANATLENTFNPIGGAQAFSGKFDGLGYSIPFWSDDEDNLNGSPYYYDADGYNFHIGAQIPMDSWGRLYVGAYYGYLEANDDSLNSEAKNFNVLVGHEYDLSKRTTIYSGVAYKQMENENDERQLGKMKATQVIVGLRHIF